MNQRRTSTSARPGPARRWPRMGPAKNWAHLGNAMSWMLLPLLALLQMFDLRRSLTGGMQVWSLHLIGFTLITLTLAPLAWARRRELRSPLGLMAALFTGTLAYALLTVALTGRPYMTARRLQPPIAWTAIPDLVRIVPLAGAFVAMTAAVLYVLVTPPQQRFARLWWASWVVVVTAFAAWPRAMVTHESTRLATGMGGSATVHLVLLLCLGIYVAAAARGHRPRASIVGALLSAGAILLTGSRAGLLCLLIYLAALTLWALRRVSPRLVLALVAVGLAALALLLALVPGMRRLLSPRDELRAANLHTALAVLGQGWRQGVFGAGSGRLWPWYAYESHLFQVPWRGKVATEFGPALTNPHSVPLGVLTELGLVGFTAVLVMLAVPVVLWWRRRDLALLPVVAGMVAFVFDYYLFKSFAIAFWWWVVVGTLTLRQPRPQVSGRPGEPAPDPTGG